MAEDGQARLHRLAEQIADEGSPRANAQGVSVIVITCDATGWASAARGMKSEMMVAAKAACDDLGNPDGWRDASPLGIGLA